jgi:Domain of unknown function (DUF4184)
MPFTFSHPAAVLPLGWLPKRWVSMTGLIIGSIAPDFEYFLRLRGYSIYSHTWKGMFWFDLPLSIIIAFIYHQLVRDKLLENLPASLSRRLLVFKNFNWPGYFKVNFLVVIYSILIGVASHIIWDRITHEQIAFVETVETFQQTVTIAGRSVHIYRFLQQSNTVIGLLVIMFAVYKLPQDTSFKKEGSIFLFWFSVTLIAAAVLGERLGYLRHHHNFAKNLAVTIISGTFLGLILTSLVLPKKT